MSDYIVSIMVYNNIFEKQFVINVMIKKFFKIITVINHIHQSLLNKTLCCCVSGCCVFIISDVVVVVKKYIGIKFMHPYNIWLFDLSLYILYKCIYLNKLIIQCVNFFLLKIKVVPWMKYVPNSTKSVKITLTFNW